MAVELAYRRLTLEKFQSVTATQEIWDDFVDCGLPGFTISEVLAMGANPSAESQAKLIEALQKQRQDPTQLDVSKDWHVLYYLLTGSAEIAEEHRPGQPLHNVIFGGIRTSVATGYGPVRYFDLPLVSEIATALKSIGRTQLVERFVPEEMSLLDIYAPPKMEEREVILNLFERLRSFFDEAVEAKEYVIAYGY
jgi:hypothetical protein